MSERDVKPAFVSLAAMMASAALAGAATAAEPAPNANGNFEIPREALEARAIEKWQANGSQGIWIEVAGGRWLYATFQSPCTDLPSSVSARFRWSLSPDLQVGASVMTAAGTVCEVRHIDRVKGAGSTARIDGGKNDTDLEGVVVEGREPIPAGGPQDVPRCGLRSIVWALTRPGSAWRLLTPVENTGAAAACLTAPAPGYRWSTGVVP